MKNFNMRSYHGHHGQRAVNRRNTHTHLDRTHLLARLHQHRYNHVVRSASSAITHFGIDCFYVEDTSERGSKPGDNLDSLPTNRHHILEEKIQRPGWDLNRPAPSNIGDTLAWPRARAPRLTH